MANTLIAAGTPAKHPIKHHAHVKIATANICNSAPSDTKK